MKLRGNPKPETRPFTQRDDSSESDTSPKECPKDPDGKNWPDRTLPRDEGGEPKPETDSPHTQLGKSKGGHPQAREFDGNGKPVRDIDIDERHGPHQHDYKENPTGGTRQRSKEHRPIQHP